MFIEKLDEDLDRVWTKSLEAPETYDMYGGDCASDALGNIYAVGAYEVSTPNQGGPTNSTAGILTKLNSSGVVQWTRRIGPGTCGSFIVGLTATNTGDIYLSAVTFANNTDIGLIGGESGLQEFYSVNKMLVARLDTQGAAVWQRYIDVRNLFEQWDSEDNRGQAVAVFGDKFAVDGYGESWNTTPYYGGESADREYDYFVVQLPTDGTALTIGNLDFTESRMPARFVTHATSTSPLANTVYAETVLVETSDLVADAEARVANSKINSDTYDYVFGADGTLTIPNDGDIKLTQSQVGYMVAIGGGENNSDHINSRAVTVDSQGNMYVGGEDQDDNEPFITKFSPDGVKVWGVTINENTEGHPGRVNGLAIHPATGAVMAVCEMYDGYTYSTVITLDQDTGHILDNEKFSDSDADVYLNDIAYTSTGNVVLAGSKYGEFTANANVTPQLGSTTGTIIILRSDLPNVAPSSWQIGGTGFSVFENVAYVERYTGLTGNVRQGSGAVFTIDDNGNGTYSASITSSGTNYLAGHKIKIVGTSLGGATPDNDIIITVDAVGGSGNISSVSNSGTAAGNVEATYTGLSGTNYNVGSGFTFTYEGPRSTTDYDYWNDYSVTNGGSNYVENDVIVILGTSLGGASTANDMTVRVNASGGTVQSINSFTGTAQSTKWKLETTTQVNFGGSGSWAIVRPLDRENLLITPGWTRTFGTDGDEEDRLYAVAVDSSNNIIAVGQGHGDVNGDEEDLAMVYKFNSSGTLQWARKLNEVSYDCYAKSVTTIGTDIYVTHESNDDGETVITKLDASGTVKWQRITNSGDDSVITRTQDGNLLVGVEGYDDDADQDALKVFLMTPSGEVIYKRWLLATTDDQTAFKNGRCLAVDSDSFYITAYFDANSYNSSIAARLPLDGSGTGEYGSFSYKDVNPMGGEQYGPFGDSGLDTDTNYEINTINIDEDSYAGALTEGEEVYVKSTATLTTGEGEFYVDTYTPDLTVEIVRDTDGGSIVFADGSKQSTSATDIPQRRYTGQKYTLGLKDRGHHILCTESNDSILVPYDARVEFPIGTVITIVNTSSSSVYIYKEGGSIDMMIAGDDFYNSVELTQYGMATLLKVGRENWVIAGNVIPAQG
jgi:hypothetical protein